MKRACHEDNDVDHRCAPATSLRLGASIIDDRGGGGADRATDRSLDPHSFPTTQDFVASRRATPRCQPACDYHDKRPQCLGSGCSALGETASGRTRFDDEPGDQTEEDASRSDRRVDSQQRIRRGTAKSKDRPRPKRQERRACGDRMRAGVSLCGERYPSDEQRRDAAPGEDRPPRRTRGQKSERGCDMARAEPSGADVITQRSVAPFPARALIVSRTESYPAG